MIGTCLGPYELQEEIGKGGMATVYRAYQASVDRQVAVKVIHKSIMGDEAALERFRREARLIARLEHPHILPVYDFDGAHEPPYIVMRYVDSGTLKDVITRQRLPLNEIGYLMRQVAAALDYAHQQGIVHRDVKPSNIMLDKQGNAIVSDFGIARLVDAKNVSVSLTATGGAVGTPDYMPPEQVLGNAVDGRADVYALGMTLFQLLTGQTPFTGDSTIAVMMKHVNQPPPRVTIYNPTLPSSIDDALLKALAKDPNDRYPTAGDFVAEVVRALGGSVLDAPSTLSYAAQTTAARLKRAEAQTVGNTQSTSSNEQHKVVTALAANAADYGDLMNEAKGAEAARRALQSLHERMEKIVAAHDGQLVEHSEREWLAVWGATAIHEDNAERAVRAALDMQAAVRELGAGVFTESEEEPLPLNLGAHTGLALLTPGEKKDTFSASGATLTLAQKLASAATGSILISPDTYREVQGSFNMEEDVPLKLRGRKDPLPTFRVTAVKARSFRVRTYDVAGVETKMVGRETEFKQLTGAYLSAFEETETQVLTAISDAGLGKSRLLNEFSKWYELRPEIIRIFEGRAIPAMTQRPYALWRDVLSFRFEILDNDPLPVVKQKMENGVAELLREPNTEMAHLMGYLAGFDFSDSPHVKGLLGDAKQLTTRARQLIFRFFERLGKIQPAIIKLEDVHHADDASLDLFNELPIVQPELPLTIVYLARPALIERRPAWGNAQSFHARVTLSPLNKRDSRDLARELLQKIPDPPKELRDLLVERAEGNPLFMEELVRMLLEDRVILAEGDQWRVEESRLAHVRVPPSLMGMLQARVDALLYAEKLTLQRASAFGRSFYDTLLLAMDSADDFHLSDLPAALKALETRGFIQRRETSSFTGSVEYAFTQGMLRDMLYVTLLERQRRTYHAASAAWLAQGERVEEYLPLIAEHYEKAEDTVRASEYLERAGDKATRLSSFNEALQFYTRVQPPTASLYLKIAEARYRLSDFPAARAAIQQAQAIAHTDADRALALAILGEMESNLGDYPAAQKVLAEAVPLARSSADQFTLCRALYSLGDVNWRLGKLDEARVVLDESLDLARALGDVTRELFALNRLGVLCLQIDLTEAKRYFVEVHKRAVTAGNRERAGTALNNLGVAAVDEQDYAAARDYFQEGLALAREMGAQQSIALYINNLAESNIKLGNLPAARAELREGLALALRIGATPWIVSGVKDFALLTFAEGDSERAFALMGLARRHPAWSSDFQREMDFICADWKLDPATAGELLEQKSAGHDWDKTIEELLKE